MTTINRWFPHPLASAVIFLAWLTLSSTMAVAHLLLGALLAWGIPRISSAFLPRRVRLSRPLLALRLLMTVLYDIVLANLIVARLILGPVSALRPAFIRIPLEIRKPYAIFSLASIITLTPGTVSAVVSADRQFLIVHVLHLEHAHALVAKIKDRYETPLKEIFEC